MVAGVEKAKMSGEPALRHVGTCSGRSEMSMSSILNKYSAINVGGQLT